MHSVALALGLHLHTAASSFLVGGIGIDVHIACLLRHYLAVAGHRGYALIVRHPLHVGQQRVVMVGLTPVPRTYTAVLHKALGLEYHLLTVYLHHGAIDIQAYAVGVAVGYLEGEGRGVLAAATAATRVVRARLIIVCTRTST